MCALSCLPGLRMMQNPRSPLGSHGAPKCLRLSPVRLRLSRRWSSSQHLGGRFSVVCTGYSVKHPSNRSGVARNRVSPHQAVLTT